MSDPADKSDDLIAELARLMATPATGNKPAVQPVTSRPAAAPAAAQPAPPALRIPGMDPPAPKAAAPAAPAATAQSPAPVQSVQAPSNAVRPPATGTIRIPGMDQPGPVATTVPVGKFEFAGAAPVRTEPVLSLGERIARQEQAQPKSTPSPAAPTAPVAANQAPRVPAGLTPINESRSFGEGPAPAVGRPAAPAAPAAAASSAPPADFHFDFGFSDNPPQPSNVPQLRSAAPADPIAALIEADMVGQEPEATAAATSSTAEPDADAPAEPRQQANVMRLAPAQAAPATKPVIAQLPVSAAKPVAATPIPLKPVPAAPRNPAADRFMVAPDAGIEMKAPEPIAPPRGSVSSPDVGSDPMAEIESLIGEAVRVELAPEPVRVQTPQVVSPHVELESEPQLEAEIHGKPEAPVVPPLTAGFAPRRARLKDEPKPSAEDAILAAVAAGGADGPARVEPAMADESPYRRLKIKPQRTGFLSGGMRQYIGMAVAGTLLLAAGLGLYWVLNMGRVGNVTGANAPQLTADTTPVKVKPAQTAKPETDAAKSPVLAKIDGASSAASAEQLVSTEDTTASVVTRDVTPTDADSEGGLANRKVRTVTVRPDGTIVSGDDAVAGTEALPVDRPNVPDVPSTATTTLLNGDPTPSVAATTTTLPSVTDSATEPTAAASATETITDAPVIDPTAVAPKPLTFPVRVATTTPLAAPTTTLGSTAPKNTAVNAVVGAQTPNGQIDLLGGGTTQPAATQPVQTATAGGGAPAYVQLSSQPTQGDAQASAKLATAKFGALFGGQKLVVQQADLGQKGIRWRVRLPASSLSQAQSICAQIKAQGGDCFASGG